MELRVKEKSVLPVLDLRHSVFVDLMCGLRPGNLFLSAKHNPLMQPSLSAAFFLPRQQATFHHKNTKPPPNLHHTAAQPNSNQNPTHTKLSRFQQLNTRCLAVKENLMVERPGLKVPATGLGSKFRILQKRGYR